MLKVTLIILCLTLPVCAQESSKIEIFGGYEYTRSLDRNYNGWTTAITANVNNWLGLTADLAGTYRPAPEVTPPSVSNINLDLSEYTFLFGPTFSYNKSQRIKPYAHMLFGVSHLTATSTSHSTSGQTQSTADSNNAFGMALGGGIDVGLQKHIAVRLIQPTIY